MKNDVKAKRLILEACPPPDQSSEKQLKRYMRAGFNLVAMTEDFVKAESQAYLNCLRLCEKLGLDVYIRGYDDQAPTYFEKHFPNVDFNEYPAVKGIFPKDEPDKDTVKLIANEYVPWFNENYAGKRWYLNTYCADDNCPYFQGTPEDYFNFLVESVYDKVDTTEKYLSVDEYPLRRGADNKNYLKEKYLIPFTALPAVVCRDNGIKFGFCIQSFMGGFQDVRMPLSIGEYRFLVYVGLAFGAQHLTYFTYRSDSKWDFSGLVTEDGRPNKQYFMVQRLNRELLSFDTELLSYDWKGALLVDGETSETPNVYLAEGRLKLKNYTDSEVMVKAQNDLICGCFEKKNKHAYVLVNYGEPTLGKVNEIELQFKKAKEIEVVVNGGKVIEECITGAHNVEKADKRERIKVIDGKVKLTLKDGDGMFIKVI